MSRLSFFLAAYADARRDPFLPASPLAACVFVFRHWHWLRRLYS